MDNREDDPDGSGAEPSAEDAEPSAEDAEPSAEDAEPSAEGVAETGILLRLPEDARSAFKDPLGPVFTEADALLAEAGEPLVAVGDAVTYHLRTAGFDPDVAVVDGLTEREAVDAAMRETVVEVESGRDVWNPAATLTADLLSSLRLAIEAEEPRTIVVDGEEDLATLPVILAVPDGVSVVYGQPGEGMVHVEVDGDVRERARELFGLLAGDHHHALELLGVDHGDG